jgi:large conductance mechanosensitive channel
LIVAFVIFFIIRSANKLKRAPAPVAATTKECPFCHTTIPLAATRCPNCTSNLG